MEVRVRITGAVRILPAEGWRAVRCVSWRGVGQSHGTAASAGDAAARIVIARQQMAGNIS
jgi:hypothetical protein